ncbi:MAG: TlpA disulfide reductase family protein [Chloroflexi bacterium]|nr:TlpA disulfide reductase family protein [Chloroflexota bacterium]
MRGRGWGFAITAVPVAALIALMAWALTQSGGNPGGIGVNDEFGEVSITTGPAPPLSLPLVNGGSIDLAELRGKVVMIDFWSSWCPPCIEEAPVLAEVYREYAGQELEFLGVAIWDEADDIDRYIRQFDLSYPNGLDARGAVAINYGVRGIPEKYFIDREGQLVRKFSGPVSAEELRAIIDAMLGPGS